VQLGLGKRGTILLEFPPAYHATIVIDYVDGRWEATVHRPPPVHRFELADPASFEQFYDLIERVRCTSG
jgi:hypothetical protein